MPHNYWRFAFSQFKIVNRSHNKDHFNKLKIMEVIMIKCSSHGCTY